MQGNLVYKYLVLAALVFSSFYSLSQEDIRINGLVKEEESNHKLESVLVEVFQDGKAYDSFTTSGSAKFEFELPLGFVYDLKFNRDEYVSKKIQFNTKYIPEEDQEGGFKYDIDISLFKYEEGFDRSILDEPMGIAEFNAEQNAIQFDFEYTKRIQNKIKAEFIRLENLEKAELERRKKFEELLIQGSDNMTKEKFAKAVDNYEEALGMFPDEEEAQKKLEEAKAALALQNKDAELEAKFQALVKEGNSLMKSKEYESSLSKFQEANSLKPEEREPKDKIRELEDLIAQAGDRAKFDEYMAAGDASMTAEDWQTAVDNFKSARDIIPDDKEMKSKLSEAQEKLSEWLANQDAAAALEKRYNDLIEKADNSFSDEDYGLAISQYEQALELKEEEKYPKDQIAEANEKLAELKDAEAANAASAEQDALDAEYQGFIDEGNSNFTAENLEEAKSAYGSALELKPTEKYPRQRIKKIEELLKEREAENEANSLADEEAEKERLRLEELEKERQRQEDLADEERRKLQAEIEERERLAELRRQEEEDENSRRNLASNIDTNAEKRAEEFYRQQKVDEDEERYSKAEKTKDNYQNWLADKAEMSLNDSKDKNSDISQVKNSVSRIYTDGSNYQKDKRENFDSGIENIKSDQANFELNAADKRSETAYKINEKKANRSSELLNAEASQIANNSEGVNATKARLDQNKKSYAETGEVLRKDNEYAIQRYKEEAAEIDKDGEHSRQQSENNNQKVKDANKRFLEENSQLQAEKISDVSENLNSVKEKQAEIRAEANDNRAGNSSEVEFIKTQRKNQLLSDQESSSMKGKIARDEAFSADRGNRKDVDDYLAVEGTEDLAEGVTQRSFEINQGRKIVIERTVKIGNKVDTYLKVIDKTATYFFKNNRSITKGTWERETLAVAD